MCLKPQRPRGDHRVNPRFPPPVGLIAAAMGFAVMSAAERYGELITDLAAQGASLGKSQVVGVRRLTPANETGVFGDRSDVVPVPNPAQLWQGQQALVDRRRRAPTVLSSGLSTMRALWPSEGLVAGLGRVCKRRRG